MGYQRKKNFNPLVEKGHLKTQASVEIKTAPRQGNQCHKKQVSQPPTPNPVMHPSSQNTLVAEHRKSQ
jgi:hypothetical protein